MTTVVPGRRVVRGAAVILRCEAPGHPIARMRDGDPASAEPRRTAARLTMSDANPESMITVRCSWIPALAALGG